MAWEHGRGHCVPSPMPRGHVAVLSLALLACCTGAASMPPEPPPGHLRAGVQIWNGTNAPLRCRAALVGENGERHELTQDLVVPVAATRVDPSLGGDPNSVREVTGSVPPGTWTFVIEAGDQIGRLPASWPAANWAVVFVLPDGMKLFGDLAPRRLE